VWIVDIILLLGQHRLSIRTVQSQKAVQLHQLLANSLL